MSDENDPANLLREMAAMAERQERAKRADEDRKPIPGFCVDVHSAELGNLIQAKLRRLEELDLPQHDHFSKTDRVRAQRLLSCLLPHLIEGVTYRLSMQEMGALVGPETCETASMIPTFPASLTPTSLSYQEEIRNGFDEIEFREGGRESGNGTGKRRAQ